MTTNLTILRHNPADSLGNFLPAVQRRGIQTHIVDSYYEPLDDFDPLAPDILVVLGGSPGAYQASDYDFLKAEIGFLEKRLTANKAVFGICLGAQMMAKALGAECYIGRKGPEKGWFDLHIHKEAREGPVRHFADIPVLQWHGDTFDLPEGATLLASSDKYQNQIFSYGRNAMALQCHAEITLPTFKGWMVSAAKDIHSGALDLKAAIAEMEHKLPALQKRADLFMDEWLDQVLEEDK